MLKKTEIMSEMDHAAVHLEELENNRLMMEITPMSLDQDSAVVYLDETGIKRLKKFLAGLEKQPERAKTLVEVLYPKTFAKLNDTINGALTEALEAFKEPKEAPFTDGLGVEFGCNDE
jgi:hypothetical protein